MPLKLHSKSCSLENFYSKDGDFLEGFVCFILLSSVRYDDGYKHLIMLWFLLLLGSLVRRETVTYELMLR